MTAQQPPSEEGEVWRDVPGYEGLYLISDRGRVWSVPRKTWHEESERSSGYWRQHGGQLLKPNPNSRGYLTVALARDGSKKTHQVHVLVALAFLGPRPEGQEVCHGDGDRTNNRLENLRYDTRKSNHADKLRHGTMARGDRNGRAILTEDDVREIRRLYESTLHLSRFHPDRWTHAKLGEKYGVTPATVSAVIRGENWKHIEQEAA